jgi:5-methylcytosine-specific restriction endonuclease McrA
MPTANRPRGRRWVALSKAVIARDRGVCHICHRGGANTADHLVPVSMGGDWWAPSNLAAAHRGCNSRRGNRVSLRSNPSKSW